MVMLDIRTITISSLLINILIAILVYSVWKQNRNQYKGVGFMLTNNVCQVISIPLALLRGLIPDFLSIVVSNIFVIGGVLFFLVGISYFVNSKIKILPNAIFMLLFTIAYFYYGIIEPLLSVRVLIMSFGFIFISLQIIWFAFGLDKKTTTLKAEMIGASFILFLIVNSLRIVVALLAQNGNDYFINDGLDGIFLIMYQLVNILVTYSIVLTINKRFSLEVNKHSEERERMLTKLNHLATIDGLTNIFNRMKIEEILIAEIVRYKRYGHPLSIMLIDIDHFKAVNDNHGHLTGDMVLLEMASLLSSSLRETDYIGRWGGDEFLVIIPSTGIEETKILATKLLAKSANHEFHLMEPVTISIGVAASTKENLSLDLLISADKALYSAKANGRNQIELYPISQ
jgi:diguanylate cyclase (GGDEF)-like protein